MAELPGHRHSLGQELKHWLREGIESLLSASAFLCRNPQTAASRAGTSQHCSPAHRCTLRSTIWSFLPALGVWALYGHVDVFRCTNVFHHFLVSLLCSYFVPFCLFFCLHLSQMSSLVPMAFIWLPRNRFWVLNLLALQKPSSNPTSNRSELFLQK